MKFRVYIIFIGLVLAFFSCKTSQAPIEKTSSSKSKNLSDKQEKLLKYTFVDANREKILGNYAQAIEKFNKCIEIDQTNSASMYELANLYHYQHQDALALKLSKKASSLDPKNEWYQVLTATLYGRTGDLENSSKIFRKLSTNYPHKIEYHYELANNYKLMSRFKDALEVYNEIELQIGVSEDVSLQKNAILLQQGEVEKAVTEFEKLIKSNPNEPHYYILLADLYQVEGMKEKALEIYKRLKDVDPDNPSIHLSLANYYRNAGEKEKSFHELKTAFGNSELDIDTKVHILLSYYTITKIHNELKEQAFELLEILTNIHPKEAKSYSIYGDFLMRDKNLEGAREKFRKAVELDKDKFVIWNQLLLIESDLKDFKAMSEESAAALELFPSQPSFYFFNGFAHIQLKNYDEAIEILEQGKEIVFDNKQLLEQFYANLGDAYYKKKNYPMSDSSYNETLKINPNNTLVLNNYSYYLSLRNENLEKAEEMSRKSNELESRSPSFADTYGWVLYKLGKYEEAKEWIEKAIDFGGDKNAVILEHLGDILFQLSDQQSALEYWKKAKAAGDGSEFLDQKIAEGTLYE